jgi:hypothetical protein
MKGRLSLVSNGCLYSLVPYIVYMRSRQPSKLPIRVDCGSLNSAYAQTTLHVFAVDLLADRPYSKSPASLQQIREMWLEPERTLTYSCGQGQLIRLLAS